MKYDSQLTELKNLLPACKNILIALPAGADIDRLAAGLALFLSLDQYLSSGADKQLAIVCDDSITVGQSHLFGVDHIQKNLPQTTGGNFVVTLEGVAIPDATAPKGGSVPGLQTLDYFVSGNNLDLVFNVTPGQTFQPARVIPHHQGSGFNLILVVGAANLNALGNLYAQNQQMFSGVHIVNIDNQMTNTSFGSTNIQDSQVASVSEMMVDLIQSLGLILDSDVASNLLAGIFELTANLTSSKVTADTYMAVANCLRVGGRRPTTQISPAGLDLSSLMPPIPSSVSPSPEERPAREGLSQADTIEPEPGWLTPKVFKGTSVG